MITSIHKRRCTENIWRCIEKNGKTYELRNILMKNIIIETKYGLIQMTSTDGRNKYQQNINHDTSWKTNMEIGDSKIELTEINSIKMVLYRVW
jgi:hypothetical protein